MYLSALRAKDLNRASRDGQRLAHQRFPTRNGGESFARSPDLGAAIPRRVPVHARRHAAGRLHRNFIFTRRLSGCPTKSGPPGGRRRLDRAAESGDPPGAVGFSPSIDAVGGPEIFVQVVLALRIGFHFFGQGIGNLVQDAGRPILSSRNVHWIAGGLIRRPGVSVALRLP